MSNRPGRKISRQTARRPPPRRQQESSLDRRVLLVISGLVGIGILVGLVAVLTGNGTSDPKFPQTSDVAQVNGNPLPAFTDGQPDAAVGLEAPTFFTTDFDGFTREVFGDGNPSDTAKVLGFFAHWCGHCQNEVPIVSNWLNANTLPDGVEVIAVSTFVSSARDNYPPSDWFVEVNWPSPVLMDSSSDTLGNAFGLSSVPFWVVLDNNNTVLARQSGSIGADAFAALVDMAGASLNN